MLGILEYQSLTLAFCSRLETCTIKILCHRGGSSDNEDLRGFAELLSTVTSPVLTALTLSLYVPRGKDDSIVRRVTFSEMCTFNWASVELALARSSSPYLRSLIVEGKGETVVLEDHIARVLPGLHARRVLQLVSYSEN